MKVISAIVGLLLLGASFILAYLSSNNATEMIAKKDAIVMQYIKQSDEAMESEDIKGAIKFAKLAIVVDPKSKQAFKTYETIIEAKYKPVQGYIGDSSFSSQKAPSAEEEEEEEEDMGC